MTGFWDQLGLDSGLMPEHLPMGVDEEGQGPVEPDPAHHYVCWCHQDCPLNQALRASWTAGLVLTGYRVDADLREPVRRAITEAADTIGANEMTVAFALLRLADTWCPAPPS